MNTRMIDEVFDGQLEDGLHYGSQVAVYKDGKPVYSRHGGFTDRRRSVPVTEHTPFMIYSVTKSLVASAVHRPAGQGMLDLEAPAARYWPEFAAGGKESITVEDLLTHRAGLQYDAGVLDLLSWFHPAWMARRLARRPVDPATRGTCFYHTFSAHIALAELVRRVTGLPAARYLEKEFFRPLAMNDTYAGLPFRHYSRAAKPSTADPAQTMPAAVFGNPVMRRVFLPAASVNTTAGDLSRFYAMLAAGGIYGGRRFVAADALARATEPAYDGPDGDTGNHIVWSRGFSLGGYSPWPDKDVRFMGREGTRETFGHAGQGGCALAWADPSRGLAMAFVNNRFQEMEIAHRRAQAVSDAVREVFG